MSKDNEKIRVGLSRFGDIVFDTLTRLLQEGDGQEGGEEFACSEQVVVAEDRRLPERTMRRLLKRVVESGLLKHDGKQHKWL